MVPVIDSVEKNSVLMSVVMLMKMMGNEIDSGAENGVLIVSVAVVVMVVIVIMVIEIDGVANNWLFYDGCGRGGDSYDNNTDH